jgi:hypothetical protein
MQSSADRQVEALEDVERIAHALYEEVNGWPWKGSGDGTQEHWCTCVRALLHRDVIRVGHRPVVQKPMTDQMIFEEQARHDRREALDDRRPTEERRHQ